MVPDWEQPYKVPQNWCWIHLLDSFENRTDSKKKIPQKEYLQDGKIAVVDQGQNLIGGYTNDRAMTFAGNVPVIILVIIQDVSNILISPLPKVLMVLKC